MAPKRKDLPEDPRDYYVHNPCSLAELAKLYKGQKGCSLPNLKLRCSREKWVKQLENFDAEVKERADEIIIQAKAQEIANNTIIAGEAATTMLLKVRDAASNMKAFKNEKEVPNRYCLEVFKVYVKCMAEAEIKANAAGGTSGDECGFIGLPGIDADAL